ncbi:MAG: Holliday junction resolvase RuvX [Patescibacteria group bacterium]
MNNKNQNSNGMKCVGIDYGTKRVGVAVSDEAGRLAFPKMTLPNDKMLISDVVAFIKKEKAECVVVGESKNNQGLENPVMQGARDFAKMIERETGLTVVFEPEFYSSLEARRLMDGGGQVDAEAAAIILNSYLARINTYDDFN